MAAAGASESLDSREMLAVERARFGTTHQHLGSALCEAWGFPEFLACVAEHHHGPLASPEAMRPLVALVHVAELLASPRRHELDRATWEADGDPEVLRLLGLEEEDLVALAERLEAVAEQAEAAYS